MVVGAFAWILLACVSHFALAQAPAKAVGTVKSTSDTSVVITTDAGTENTITNSLEVSGKPIIVYVSPQTSIRRYAPDSIRFDDAQPGTLDQIKPGDQLRARGTKNADGTVFIAQAIVSGTFREIAGTVVS